MATSNKIGMLARILNRDPHVLIPAIGNRRQFAIELRSQTLYDPREWVVEIFVFSATETVTRHDHTTAKSIVLRVKGGQGLALFGSEYILQQRTSLFIQLLCNLFPIQAL